MIQAPRESECSRRAPAWSVLSHPPFTPELLEIGNDLMLFRARRRDQFLHLVTGHPQCFQVSLWLGLGLVGT